MIRNFKTIGITCKSRLEDKHGIIPKIIKFLQKEKKIIYTCPRIKSKTKSNGTLKALIPQAKIDLLIVLGGDGTVLRATRELNNFSTFVFGINMGHLGFLSEIEPKHFDKTFKEIFKGNITIDSRTLLEVCIYRKKKCVLKGFALNDAVINQSTIARLISLKTYVDNKILCTYKSDGLIISTPTGSTAYILAAGGPIVYPTVDAFIIAPICSHSFSQKPIVIPDTKEVSVTVENIRDNTIHLTLDGQISHILSSKDKITIKKHKEPVKFIRLMSESYFATLRKKLGWG